MTVAKLAMLVKIMRDKQAYMHVNLPVMEEKRVDQAIARILATETQPTMFNTDQRKGAY